MKFMKNHGDIIVLVNDRFIHTFDLSLPPLAKITSNRLLTFTGGCPILIGFTIRYTMKLFLNV